MVVCNTQRYEDDVSNQIHVVVCHTLFVMMEHFVIHLQVLLLTLICVPHSYYGVALFHVPCLQTDHLASVCVSVGGGGDDDDGEC